MEEWSHPLGKHIIVLRTTNRIKYPSRRSKEKEYIFYAQNNTRSNSMPTSLVFSTIKMKQHSIKSIFHFSIKKSAFWTTKRIGAHHSTSTRDTRFIWNTIFLKAFQRTGRISSSTAAAVAPTTTNNNRHTIRFTWARKSNFSLHFSLLRWHRRWMSPIGKKCKDGMECEYRGHIFYLENLSFVGVCI